MQKKEGTYIGQKFVGTIFWDRLIPIKYPNNNIEKY